MAKKFAEITGIHKIFNIEELTEEPNDGTIRYTEMVIQDGYPELKENIDENTIIFVTADGDDVNRIIGPNDYKISKDDCFIVAQNKVYATFGKVNVSDVMGPTGNDGENGLTPHIDPSTGNWFIGTEDTGVKAQGPQGIQGIQGIQGPVGPTGSQYIQLDLTDDNFTDNAQQIIETENIRIGDYSISNDTNTIWKCISDTEFSPGPSIKGNSGQASTSDSIPVGSIMMFAGDEAPYGWVFCRGQQIEVSIDGNICTELYSNFQELVYKIGTKYGFTYSTGKDVFGYNTPGLVNGGDKYYITLPDFSMKFPYGAGSTNDPGKRGGKSEVTLEKQHIPYHTHDVSIPSELEVYDGSGSLGGFQYDENNEYSDRTYYTSAMNGNGPISNQSFSILPPYLTINFIIKYM